MADKPKYALQNVMQEAVEDLVSTAIEEMDVCRCEKCRMDVMALALNQLPAHYRVMEQGYVLQRYNLQRPQNRADIMAALYRAATMVKEKPQHDIN